MRKITAILLLFAFVAAQYAKQAAYLECRLTNYFNKEAGKCDCEKIFSRNSNTVLNDSPLPVIHSHIHIDESYFAGKIIVQQIPFFNVETGLTTFYQSHLQNGFCFIADHPPQIG